MFKRYHADPLGTDAEVRKHFKIPDDKYYSVGTWPEQFEGDVHITAKLVRTVKSAKISKSDQKSNENT